jgi:hypothetical protein
MYEALMTESIRMRAIVICKLEIVGRHGGPRRMGELSPSRRTIELEERRARASNPLGLRVLLKVCFRLGCDPVGYRRLDAR